MPTLHEFDTLEQAVAQVCPCAICRSGGICDRAKKLTARIRSIKTAEPVTETETVPKCTDAIELAALRKAVEPFKEVARRIPAEWPATDTLDGFDHLLLGAEEPTIENYRALLATEQKEGE